MKFFREIYYFKCEPREDYPPVDIYETEDTVIVLVDLPGIKIEDIIIKVYGNELIIEGIKQKPEEEKNVRYICMEREFNTFRRRIHIPVAIDPSSGKAIYKNGVLNITLPKIEDKVYKIKIEKE